MVPELGCSKTWNMCRICTVYVSVCDVCIGERSIHPHLCVQLCTCVYIYIYLYTWSHFIYIHTYICNHRVSTQHYGVATPVRLTSLHGFAPALTAAVAMQKHQDYRDILLSWVVISINTICYLQNWKYLWIVFSCITSSSLDQFAQLPSFCKKWRGLRGANLRGCPLLVI